MKKVISLILAAIMLFTLAVTLCSCEKVECDLCGNEDYKNKMTVEEVFGEKIYYCKDCKEDLEALGDLFD